MTALTALLSKYDVAGPRYTSYPTVPCWDHPPSQRDWLDHLDRALTRSADPAQGPRGAAVYVHVPFCRSLCTYCGCTTRITTKPVGAPYVDSVLAEWQLLLDALGRRDSPPPIAELHLGGGTPTFLSGDELASLIDGIGRLGAFVPGAELSLEADPRVTTSDQLAVLALRGFTRLSLGVQDFDARVQHAIHRIQSVAQVAQVTEAARALGFTSVGYDLVYGLPHQTLDSVAATIDAVRALAPDRIAFYGYAHVPWVKRAQRGFSELDLPTPAERRALYELGRDRLVAAGYREIGMDHFARPDDALAQSLDAGTLHRSFMGYTPRPAEPLIGLGVSAISDAGTCFAQNEKTLEDYQACLAAGVLPIARGHVLDGEDLIMRHHIQRLMTRFDTDWVDGGPTWTPFLDTLSERLAPMIDDGLVALEPERCHVTAAGQAFVRNVCMAFDARLARRAPAAAPMFSRTV